MLLYPVDWTGHWLPEAALSDHFLPLLSGTGAPDTTYFLFFATEFSLLAFLRTLSGVFFEGSAAKAPGIQHALRLCSSHSLLVFERTPA